MLGVSLTHLKQTICQSPPDLRPQIGAKEEQGDFGHGYVCIIQESPFGELQTATTTVSPRAQYCGGCFGDEVQVSRHGFHFYRPGVPIEATHRGAALTVQKRGNRRKNTPIEGRRECREK